MSERTQKSVVHNAINEITDIGDGQVELTSDERKEVHALVMEQFEEHESLMTDEARAKHTTEAEMSSYVSGLISNWLKKDKRLNGNTVYQPKNPGSRTGQGDAMVRELRKAAAAFADDAEKLAEINGFLTERIAEIKAAKAKDVEIDYSVLPEGLAESLNIEESK